MHRHLASWSALDSVPSKDEFSCPVECQDVHLLSLLLLHTVVERGVHS